jgi:DNA uptake protein ComE-like DNA-binding protein
MNHRFIAAALSASFLLLGSSLTLAADTQAAAPRQAASKAAPAKTVVATKAKAPVKVKLVDINAASREELKKLTGIGDAQAVKIIAGRPYSSKADLVVQKVLDRSSYESIKGLIIAKQPYKDSAKNAALYSKKK